MCTLSVARSEKKIKDSDAVDFELKHDPIAAATSVARADRPLAPQAKEVGLSPENVFERKLREIVAPGHRVLDAGCGTGKFFSMDFARQAGCQLVGIDLRQGLSANSEIDFGVRAELNRLPFSDGSFDVVNCRLVIEHVDFPDIVLKEFYRILKPGGRLAIFTPNLLHYFGAAASLTPHWFHVWFNSRVRGFDGNDIFPTLYRANTRRRLRKLFLQSGFDRADISMVEGPPSVLAFNSLLHGMGLVYERLVNRYDFLSGFRLNIIAVAYKN
ncbi:MAG TPA: class I SAM-dependent methyltransferase [Candidatus Acidoferrales bacterium]|nr:class I SAM-dependent methyltransferase [Candidatus Acidoferrales bacterium]